MSKKVQDLEKGLNELTQGRTLPGLARILSDSDDFLYVSLDLIKIQEQVRHNIDTESESFAALKESIREKGVLEPVKLLKRETDFLLLIGERRFRACEILGLPNIPATILKGNLTAGEILGMQLAENLQREDLNIIDEAKAYVKYYTQRTGKGDLLSALTHYDRGKERLNSADEVAVSEIVKIAGKTPRTVFNVISLLKLPNDIVESIEKGDVSSTAGYVLASSMESPDFERMLKAALDGATIQEIKNHKATNESAKKQSHAGGRPLKKSYAQKLADIRIAVIGKAGSITAKEAKELLKEIEFFRKVILKISGER